MNKVNVIVVKNTMSRVENETIKQQPCSFSSLPDHEDQFQPCPQGLV